MNSIYVLKHKTLSIRHFHRKMEKKKDNLQSYLETELNISHFILNAVGLTGGLKQEQSVLMLFKMTSVSKYASVAIDLLNTLKFAVIFLSSS